MFQKTDSRPAVSPQLRRDGPISQLVGVYFLGPEFPVCGWKVSAGLAAVPEASVNEHGDFLLRKGEIRFAGNVGRVKAPSGQPRGN